MLRFLAPFNVLRMINEYRKSHSMRPEPFFLLVLSFDGSIDAWRKFTNWQAWKGINRVRVSSLWPLTKERFSCVFTAHTLTGTIFNMKKATTRIGRVAKVLRQFATHSREGKEQDVVASEMTRQQRSLAIFCRLFLVHYDYFFGVVWGRGRCVRACVCFAWKCQRVNHTGKRRREEKQYLHRICLRASCFVWFNSSTRK